MSGCVCVFFRQPDNLYYVGFDLRFFLDLSEFVHRRRRFVCERAREVPKLQQLALKQICA